MIGRVTAVKQDGYAAQNGSHALDSPIALFVVDQQASITHADLWAPELCDFSSTDFLNQPIDDVLHERDAQVNAESLRDVLLAGTAEKCLDLTLQLANRIVLPVSVRSSHVPGGAGDAVTLVTLYRSGDEGNWDDTSPWNSPASTLPGENTLLFLLGARWLSLLPPLLALIVKPPFHEAATGRIAATVFVIAFLHNLFLTAFHSRLNSLVVRTPALMGIDMSITAAFIATTGGIDSPYEIYSYTPLLASAFFFRIRGGLIAATVFMVFYFAALLIAHRILGSTDAHEVIAQILSYYLAAVVFGYPSLLLQRLHAATRQLESIQQRMVRTESLATIGRVTAHVSHEIRNPLSSIGGFAARIAQHPDDTGRVKKHATIIVDEVRRLEELLTDMLDMARQPSLNHQPASLHDILDKACLLSDGLMNHQAPVAIRKEYDPQMPPIECDAATLLRAFLNVIRNAIQIMPGGGTVTIATKREGDRAKVSITDTGPGISPELLPKLFQPFVSHRSNGTGLGLAVAHSVVAQHGGTIEAENVPGQGARFTFYLPLKSPPTLHSDGPATNGA